MDDQTNPSLEWWYRDLPGPPSARDRTPSRRNYEWVVSWRSQLLGCGGTGLAQEISRWRHPDSSDFNGIKEPSASVGYASSALSRRQSLDLICFCLEWILQAPVCLLSALCLGLTRRWDDPARRSQSWEFLAPNLWTGLKRQLRSCFWSALKRGDSRNQPRSRVPAIVWRKWRDRVYSQLASWYR